MKRHFIKSFIAFCAGVMTLCAASSLFVSCEELNELQNQEELVAEIDRLTKLNEELEAQLKDAGNAVLSTLTFRVSNENKLEFSFDGTTWTTTDVVIPPAGSGSGSGASCDCSIVDNGDSITIIVGDQSYTIEKPQPIVFEIRAGKVYFAAESTQTIAIKSSGIEDLTVIAAPKGWDAEINAEGKIEVTAPSADELPVVDWWGDVIQEGTAAASGYIKVHACTAEGKCMVGKLPVEVSENPLIVKAYDGNFEVASTDEYALVFYGVCLKENFKTEVSALLSNVQNLGSWEFFAEPAASGKISDVLGAEPEVGKEYVVWAFVMENELPSIDELVLAYYSPVNVTAVEDETKRTAYDNWISLTVQGADSYYVVAVPDQGDFGMSAEDMKSLMIEDIYYMGAPSGKQFTEDYEGSFYQITAGTQAYVGEATPGTTGTLLVLPIDGRPDELYTVEDIWSFEFTTNELVSGGAADAVAVEVFKAEKYNNETWEYELMPTDPYSELAVEVAMPASDWKYFYFAWMTPEDYALTSGADEMIVNYVLNNPASYPVSPAEIKPTILYEGLNPLEVKHFVAFFVDETGKYGEIAKLELQTEELVKSEIALQATAELENGTLKNNSVLKVALTADMEVSKYKYAWTQTNYYNQYEGSTPEEMADVIFFGEVNAWSGFYEVKPDQLTDGKLIIEGHEYGAKYYLAILPYDAENKPGKAAVILEYNCAYELSSVITDPTAFLLEPKIEFTVPERVSAGDRYDYEYSYSMLVDSWGSYCYYNLAYTVVAEEGVEVLTMMTTAEEVEGMTAIERASGLWARTLSPNEGAGSHDKSLNSDPAPLAAYILVSWKDAEGTYYYKEVDLSAQFEAMFVDLVMNAEADETVTETPAGKQWSFVSTSEEAFIPAGMNAVLDFGVSTPGAFVLGAEVEEGVYVDAMGGMMQLVATVSPVSETMGVVTLNGLQGFDDDDNPIFGEVDKFCYYGLDGESCSFAGSMMFGDVKDALATTVTVQGGGMAPLNK